MKKILFILTAATLFLVGCQKEKEPEPVYNDDLGGTEWKWIGNYSSEYTMTFMNEKRVKVKKILVGIYWGGMYYDYTYSDKNKSGTIKEWDDDISKCKFTISNNCLTIDGSKYYKQ